MRALFMEIKDDLIDGIYVFVAKDYINQMSYDELKKEYEKSVEKTVSRFPERKTNFLPFRTKK